MRGWARSGFAVADIAFYFGSARWIIEGGRLYREVSSDYPLFANIIFASCRYLGHFLHPGFWGFFTLWIAAAWIVFFFALYRVAKDTTMLAAMVWLGPSPIYFALLRFDVYPAVATLMSLFAIRRTAYIEGAVWLGLAAALKGYALWMLPAHCMYMVSQRGFSWAIKVGALGVAPIILSLLITFIFAGQEGMIAPFTFQALRTLNGESTYDAFNYLFNLSAIPDGSEVRWVAQSLQVGCALAAAAMRPRSFDDLIDAFLLAILGFISFSVFYSPQYVLWLLPLVSFSESRVMVISAIVLSWLTFLYFPIGRFLYDWCPSLLKTAVTAISLIRLFMMFWILKRHFFRR
jgi:hypothetical protein